MCAAVCAVVRTNLVNRRRISLLVSGISSPRSVPVPLYGLDGAGHDQERGGGHGQSDVRVPGVVTADLVLVQADLFLRRLERLLSAPPVMYLKRVLLSGVRQ
jgi:hypothetical protein